jgi:hypothetical protein
MRCIHPRKKLSGTVQLIIIKQGALPQLSSQSTLTFHFQKLIESELYKAADGVFQSCEGFLPAENLHD